MKKAFLISTLLFAVYSISVAKSELRFKGKCSVILSNKDRLNNNWWWSDNNNWFNNKSSRNNWWVKSYDKNEKATISISAKGDLSIYDTGNISANSVMKEALLFKIAILKKGATKSEMFSDTSFKSIAAELILEKCKPGDRIMVFLMDQENYFLLQNVIEVVKGGC